MRRPAVVSAAALFICVLCVGLIFTRAAPESYDAQIMFQVTQSMVDHADFLVHRDPLGMSTPYSFYGIGMSLLMAAPYWLAERLHQNPALWVMNVNAHVIAAIAVALFALGVATRTTKTQALAAAALTFFGTLLLPYTATGFSEPSVGLAIVLGLLAVQTRRPALAGAAAGLAVLMRVDSALLVLPALVVATWLACGRSWQSLWRFALAALPAVVVIGAYNALRFGAPWRAGYTFAAFDHPLLAGLYGLLFSPAAGLFIYVPLLPVALIGLVLALRRLPLLAGTALFLLLVRVPFYAVWFGWQAYWVWGPRYLIPAVPVLGLGLLEVCRRWSGQHLPIKLAAGIAFALSVAVQVVGASVGYEHAVMFAALLKAHPPVQGPGFVFDEARRSTQAVWDRVEFDWSLWPIGDEARDLLQGRYLVSHWLRPAVNLVAVASLLAVSAASGIGALVQARVADRPASR